MTDDARLRRWRPVTLLVVAVVCGTTLQVQVNYAQNEALNTARELARPVRELCADDALVARQLGSTTCDRAAQVAARSTRTTPSLGVAGHVVVTRLLRPPG